MKNLTIVLHLAVLVGVLGFLARYVVPIGDFMRAQVYPSTIVDLTNRDRTVHRLSRLTIDPRLMEAAKLKAHDMASHGYFSHASPDGTTPWHWLDVAEYPYSYAGENLALNFEESDQVEEAWMESVSHRGNILSSDFTEVGVAVATGTYNGQPASYVVQFFGAR